MLNCDDSLPEMLLLEWDLPGQSGEALIRRLRAQPRTRDLPIIMVSRRAGEHDKILALESGADDYLTKPFNPRELLARMHARAAPARAARRQRDRADGRPAPRSGHPARDRRHAARWRWGRSNSAC